MKRLILFFLMFVSSYLLFATNVETYIGGFYTESSSANKWYKVATISVPGNFNSVNLSFRISMVNTYTRYNATGFIRLRKGGGNVIGSWQYSISLIGDGEKQMIDVRKVNATQFELIANAADRGGYAHFGVEIDELSEQAIDVTIPNSGENITHSSGYEYLPLSGDLAFPGSTINSDDLLLKKSFHAPDLKEPVCFIKSILRTHGGHVPEGAESRITYDMQSYDNTSSTFGSIGVERCKDADGWYGGGQMNFYTKSPAPGGGSSPGLKKWMTIGRDGIVSIGNETQKGILHLYGDAKIDGIISSSEIKVQQNVWADFVFQGEYELKTLSEVEKYVMKYKHLPDVPSTDEIVKNGLSLGDMDATLLQKIEELTLYSIQQDKNNKKLEEEVVKQKHKVSGLKIKIEELKEENEQRISELEKRLQQLENLANQNSF